MAKKSAKVARRAAAMRVDAKAAKPRKTAPKSQSRKVAKPALLAGGNPQIAKADGDAPVQAYIAAMPGWKRDVGRRLDALIVRTVPNVPQGSQVELALLWHRGPGLVPQLPLLHEVHQSGVLPRHVTASTPSRRVQHKNVRYLDIHENDQVDEELLANWIRQASKLRGWIP